MGSWQPKGLPRSIYLSSAMPKKSKMRYIIFLVFLTLCGCSNRIHSAFEFNKIISDATYHILNDSVKMYHQSLGDFKYQENSVELKKQLKNQELNNVLIYGKSSVEPYYEYYLLLNPNKKKIGFSSFDYVQDTILKTDNYVFLGRGINDNFPERDFNFISQSIKVDKEYKKDIVPLNDVLKRNYNSTKYLHAYNEISQYPSDNDFDNWLKLQYEVTYLSMLGNSELYTNRLSDFEGKYQIVDSTRTKIVEKGIMGFDLVKKQILELTEAEQIIMFNENHFYPQHRILISRLLKDLRKQGFEYLALEALAKDSLLNSDFEPDVETGFYIKEQNFKNLVRIAQELGFTFVSYENQNLEIDREIGQSENLYNKTFLINPNAKVIVFAGLDHITELPSSNDKKWMAQIFKEKYQIDPLTFSQSDLRNYSEITTSDLLLIKSEFLNDKFNRVDYQILNNIDWNLPQGNFKYKNKTKEQVQISIFNNRQWKSKYGYLNKIPDYVSIIEPNKTISLDLKGEHYQIVITNKKGELLMNEKIAIANN